MSMLHSSSTAKPARVWPGADFFKHWKIGTKLSLGLSILAAMTLLVVGLSFFASASASEKINKTAVERAPAALEASRAQADLLRMLGDVRGYLALGEAQYRDSYNRSQEATRADLARLQQLATNVSAQDKQRLVELNGVFDKFAQLTPRLFALRDNQLEREPAYKLLATDGIKMGGNVLINTGNLISAQGRRASATAQDFAVLSDMAKFQGSFAAMLSGLRGYVTTRNRTYRGEYESNRDVNQADWDKLASDRTTLSPDQQKLLDAIAKDRDAFLLLPDQMISLLEGPHWREDLYLFSNEAVPMASQMAGILDQITSEQQASLSAELNTGNMLLADARWQTLVGGLVALFLSLAMALFLRQNIAGPISRVTQVAEQIRAGDLEAQARVESRDETGILAETFNNMTAQLRGTIRQVRKEKKRADDLLEVVIPIGVELASEKNFNLLLEKMLVEAKSFCRAKAGTLFLHTEDNCLKYVIFRDDYQQVALGGTTGKEIPFAPLPLYLSPGVPNNRRVPVRVALGGSPVNIPDASKTTDLDLEESHMHIGRAATSLLAIPLEDSKNRVLGVLQLIDAQDPEGEQIIPFDENLQRMMESFSALAVAALEAYIREQSLQQQIQQLKIEIDEVKRQKQVSEIVETDYFQNLQARARAIRDRARGPSEGPAKD